MRLLTEVQECISLVDKKLSHFVEALLVSNKTLCGMSQIKYMFSHLILFKLNAQFQSVIWKVHTSNSESIFIFLSSL
jgi:hypothetical protein